MGMSLATRMSLACRERTYSEDVGHFLRVIGVLLDVADAQDVVQDQAVIAYIGIHCNHSDQL